MRMEEENSREASRKASTDRQRYSVLQGMSCLLGMRSLDVALTVLYRIDSISVSPFWNGWSSDIFFTRSSWGLVPGVKSIL